jgi:hypothetical protein
MRKLATEAMINRRREMTPLFKLGEKWDIAMAALYLASDAGQLCSSCFLTRLSSSSTIHAVSVSTEHPLL